MSPASGIVWESTCKEAYFLFQVSQGFTISYVNPVKNTLVATFSFEGKL